MEHGWPIGKLSQVTGVKVPTIRFYEEIGLLPLPDRSESNRRLYGPVTAKRLRFIRHARELGFEVDAIRQLLDLTADANRSCADVDALAKAHLETVESRIARLKALQREIKRMIGECSRGRIAECRIVDVLANHDKCLSDHH